MISAWLAKRRKPVKQAKPESLNKLWCDVVRAKRGASRVTIEDLARDLGWYKFEVELIEKNCDSFDDSSRSTYIEALDRLVAEKYI